MNGWFRNFNGCSCLLYEQNIRLLQRLKRQVLVSEVISLKEKEVFYLILTDIHLQVMKSICLILPNY